MSRPPWLTEELVGEVRELLAADPRAGRWTVKECLNLTAYQAETVLRLIRGGGEAPAPEPTPLERFMAEECPRLTPAQLQELAECARAEVLADPFPEGPPESKVLEPSRPREWETALVVNDLHRPFHDHRAVELVVAFAERVQPDRLILAGDVVDCYALSRFDKDPRRASKDNVRAEVEDVRAFLAELRRRLPRTRIVYVEGNHEFRLRSYLFRNAQALTWLEELTLPALFKLDAVGAEFIGCEADRFVDTFLRWGDLLVGHFAIARGDSGATAKALLTKYGLSLIQAHCHSVGAYNRTLASAGLIKAWENGCLCDLPPHYVRPANWAHAFAVVHKERDGHYFQVEPVLMVKHQFRYGGELWSA